MCQHILGKPQPQAQTDTGVPWVHIYNIHILLTVYACQVCTLYVYVYVQYVVLERDKIREINYI